MTRQRLSHATSDTEARAALRAFVAAFHDGHFSELPVLEPASPQLTAEPPRRFLVGEDAANACAALGYAAGSWPTAFSLPFESLPDFRLDADSEGTPFRVAVVTVSGRRVGIVRLKNFSQRQSPSACTRAWAAADSARRADRDALDDAVTDEWFASLAA